MLMKTSKSTLPLFKQHFVKNVNFGQNSSNFSGFCESNFGRMYFFFFLTDFNKIYGGYKRSLKLFDSHQKKDKKGKKG